MNDVVYPVITWLQANGVDTSDLIDESGELRIIQTATGEHEILYQVARWPDGKIALHGDSVLPYTRRTPMIVPPPEGLLDSYRVAHRRALADARARQIGRGLLGAATICGPDDRLILTLPADREDLVAMAQEVLIAVGLRHRAVIVTSDIAVTVVRPEEERES